MKPDPEEEPYSDEIRREDGLERYWLFYNGEWAETIFGLAGAGGGIFWCFLWLLGYSQTLIGYVLGAIAILGFCCWYLLFGLIWRYEQRGWRRRGKSLASSERKKLYIALGLWLFIVLFFGALILSQGRPRPWGG
jgi:hypothetical protein